jgi:hypothetical protein
VRKLSYLDLENPRVPASIKKEDTGKSKEEINSDILEYLIETGSIVELMLSIGENGFFAGEALLLIKEYDQDKKYTGKYIVVEGNRRVTALKLLHDPSLANVSKNQIKEASELSINKPELIPSIIFNDRDDILKYLGYRHITGIKNWKALEKARYMNLVYSKIKTEENSHEEVCIEIAKSIGSTRSYVNRILEAYNIYLFIEEKDFFDIKGLDDTTFHFVNLSDSLNRANLNKFLLENDDKKDFNEKNLKDWTEWLFKENTEGETRLRGTSSDLSDLDNVVTNISALEAFRDRKVSLSQAALFAEDAETILSDSLEYALEYLEEADRVLTKIDDIEKVHTFDENIKDIRKIAKKIYDYKLAQSEDF